MVFSSILFLFYFLPIVLIAYYVLPKICRNTVFLLVSLLFYAWGEPHYIALMLGSIVMNYAFGLLVANPQRRGRKAWLILSVVCNLALLGVFKYTNFAVDNLELVLHRTLSVPAIALPMGISFYTFQAMSYVIDVYRQDAAPQRRIDRVALYIAAFPQLVAGPIVRYTTVMDQIEHRAHTVDKFASGISRFLVGLSKKVLLANALGAVADELFKLPAAHLSTASAWIGAICYTLQIYFDFGGYSDMAIGLGRMFGFEFLENFNYPYICQSVKDFWRRWHMSLSTWFRDYVYIPLGGNRCGARRQVCNLLIVWLLTGMWHGAAWTFIFWGLYYGLLLLLERRFRSVLDKLPRVLRHGYAMLAVIIGWVFFRADSLHSATSFLRAMFGFSHAGAVDATARLLLHDNMLVIALAVLASTPLMTSLYQRMRARCGGAIELPVKVIGGLGALALCVLYLANSTYNPFIYFRF